MMPVYKSKEKTNDNRQYYYSISYVDIYGKQHRIKSKKYATKKDAEKAEAKKLLELDKIASETMTFNQAALLFLPEKKQQMKYSSYLKFQKELEHVLEVIGDVQIDKLKVSQFQKLLESMNKKELSPIYKNKIIGSLKQLLRFTDKRYNLTSTVPDKFDNYRLEEKKEMKFITEEQLNQLLSVVDNMIYKNLFLILFYMGFRIGELNALTFDCIDFENNTVAIKQTVTTRISDESGNYLITTPKTAASVRTLPMPEIVSKSFLELRDYYTKFEEYSPKWFCMGGIRPIPESNIQTAKSKYFALAGLDPIRIHDFRHSTASYLINNGASILLVSKWLGHTNVSMTLNRYSHLYKSELLDIVNVINTKIRT